MHVSMHLACSFYIGKILLILILIIMFIMYAISARFQMCDASTLRGQGHHCNIVGRLIPGHQFQDEGLIPDLHAGDEKCLRDIEEG